MKNSSFSGSVQEEKPAHQVVKSEVKAGRSAFSRISPAAKMLIAEHGLDSSSLEATGAHGTLLKGDVLLAIRSGKASPKLSSAKERTPSPKATVSFESKSQEKQTGSFEDLPNSQIRKVRIYQIVLFNAASLCIGYVANKKEISIRKIVLDIILIVVFIPCRTPYTAKVFVPHSLHFQVYFYLFNMRRFGFLGDEKVAKYIYL